MLSTFLAVIFSGHLSDRFGAARSIALCGGLLVVSTLGFALAPGFGNALLCFGLTLGLGWGVFYTLGPIIVAMLVEPLQRARYFALLSGSMMTGIGSGPLLGRLATSLGYPVTTAFYIAALASALGAIIFWRLAASLKARPNQMGTATVSKISVSSARAVLSSRAVFPIIMVGLGGCVFGGLSSFQTSYAALRTLDYSLFFLGFMGAAITGRMLIASIVVKRDPYIASCVLSGLMVVSILMFQFLVGDGFSYLLVAIVLGVGYGLTYSVINGLAANEAPAGSTSQALLLFSLAYFVGVFGFPLLAGKLIVEQGMPALLYTVLAVAVINWLITVGRLAWRGSRAKVVAKPA
jgi:MFS family permease